MPPSNKRLPSHRSPLAPKSGAFIAIALFALAYFLPAQPAAAAIRTWVGGDDDWDADGLNWTGLDEPDPDDDAVFNTDNAVDMTIDNEVLSLALSGDISLDTVTAYLDVNGNVTLSDAGTRLRVGQNDVSPLPATSLAAYNITVNSGASFQTAGFVSFIDPAAIGLFQITSGGTLRGNGTIRNGDGISTPTAVFANDGVIRPGEVTDTIIIGAHPNDRTLTLSAIDGDARADLDGTFGNGTLEILQNQTLNIDLPLNDDFDGTIDLRHNATLDVEDAWAFSGTISVDNGFVAGSPPFVPNVPADVGYLKGAPITMLQADTTITVVDTDGTLQFDAPFVANAGTIINNGLIIFNNTATINAGTDFDQAGIESSLTVNPGVTVTINDADMDFDGSGASSNVITVESGGTLDLNLDSFEGNDRFDGTLNLNSGLLSLTVTDGLWTMDRNLNLTKTGLAEPAVTGSALEIGNDAQINDAAVVVAGTGSSRISPAVTWFSDTDVDVAAGATLAVLGFSTFNCVNGSENATFHGPGNIRFSGGQVNEATTLNFAGGTVGLDSGGSSTVLLAAPDFSIDAPLTINAATIDPYGRSVLVPSPQTSELTINAPLGGALSVMLDDPNATWNVNSVGVVHANGGNVLFETFLTGNGLAMDGTLNVDGFARSDAVLQVGPTGTVDFVDAAANLRLGGGDLTTPNRIEGGQMIGPGEISSVSARALHGFGSIACSIDFDGTTSELLADDGTLVLAPAATLVDVGVLGTADADGTLEVQQAWSTNTTGRVSLEGGELTGSAILNNGPNGIEGHGLVSAPLNNETLVTASGTGTLELNNPLNSNDWDGPANTGTLRAFPGNTLDIHDDAAFAFGGTVSADAGAVRVFGFGLQFQSGSTLSLEDGAKFRSGQATSLGGTVLAGAGAPSRLEVTAPVAFESTSAATLTGDLVLDNTLTSIAAGASFSGGGALENAATGTLNLLDGANVGVLVRNAGTLTLGASPGQVSAQDFEQAAGGTTVIEIAGAGLSDYDRLTLAGIASLDGTLKVSLLGGYAPPLGTVFSIITAPGGVVGTFAAVDLSGALLGGGLAWQVNYTPTNVQLEVITAPDPFQAWIDSFPSLTNPADKTREANPDGDRLNNLGEFGVDGDPTSAVSDGKIVGKVATVSGTDYMTLTFPVRLGAVPAAGDPPGGPLVLEQIDDGLSYTVHGTEDLMAFPLDISEVTGGNASTIQTGLPALNAGWEYRTFRLPDPVSLTSPGFLQLLISEP